VPAKSFSEVKTDFGLDGLDKSTRKFIAVEVNAEKPVESGWGATCSPPLSGTKTPHQKARGRFTRASSPFGKTKPN
jgi:hypothetical protein